MDAPIYIAVSGGMLAGKTTLARGLSSELKWQYLPIEMPAVKFLSDLFSNPDRWAFEAQASFLIHKVVQIQDAIHRGVPFILDRTIYEDVEIFAEYFHRRDAMDVRSYETYRVLSQYFLKELPVPDLVIFCECSSAVAMNRVTQRPREYQDRYPPGHIQNIYSMYEKWLQDYDRSSVVTFNSELYDTRRPELLKELCDETKSMLSEPSDGQLDLFDMPTNPRDFHLLRPYRIVPSGRRLPSSKELRAKSIFRTTQFPTAYLAAPFTSAATESVEEASLLPETPHGIISQGPYRKILVGIEKALANIGIDTFIPHRDINKWGTLTLSPSQVTSRCSKYVDETDLLIGILSTSHGSHYELGLAQGLGKPVLIIRCKELPESFIAEGMVSDSDRLLVVEVEKLSDVVPAITSNEVLRFLNRFVPVKLEASL